MTSFQRLLLLSVRLPERFRGGCAFGGVSVTLSPDTSQKIEDLDSDQVFFEEIVQFARFRLVINHHS